MSFFENTRKPVGFGGGANIRELLKKCPQGEVRGIDYSTVSVEKARRRNAAAIREERCEVWQGCA